MKTRILQKIFLSVTAGFTGLAPAGATCPTPWQLVANMPSALEGAAAASDGTYSYHARLNAFYRYDPVVDSWTTLAPMPDAVSFASAVYYPPTNKIYVFGGTATRIYDIASDTWTAGANLPAGGSGMASGYNSANARIYLVSGSSTWEYDPVTNAFIQKADFPMPDWVFASGLINGHLYVAGGYSCESYCRYVYTGVLWDYDIAADTWTARTEIPLGLSGAGSAVVLDRLWVFGGNYLSIPYPRSCDLGCNCCGDYT